MIGIIFPNKFYSIIYLWVAICTIVLPCLFTSLIFWLFKIPSLIKNIKILRIFLAISLIILTIPSMFIFTETWLYFEPGDGPALGYLGVFYIFSAFLWLPCLIILSIYATRSKS